MYPSVKSAVFTFNRKLEDLIKFMYVDIRGFVTTGVGNLIETIPKAQALYPNFRFKNGSGIASQSDIAAEWTRINNAPGLKQGGAPAAGRIAQLELSEDYIRTWVEAKADGVEKALKKQGFKDLDQWPADAQLGLISMAWAGIGPSKVPKWKEFGAASERMDFDSAAEFCYIYDTHNPGLKPRNAANKHLFQNAAAVMADDSGGSVRSALVYPSIQVKPSVVVDERSEEERLEAYGKSFYNTAKAK